MHMRSLELNKLSAQHQQPQGTVVVDVCCGIASNVLAAALASTLKMYRVGIDEELSVRGTRFVERYNNRFR